MEHFNRGHEHYKQGRYDDAIKEFKLSLENDPKNAASLFGLGNSFFLKQDFQQAIKCYQDVTQIKPDFAKAHYALALAYRRIGRNEDAEKQFELYNRLSTQKPAEAPKPPATAAKPAEAPRPPMKTAEPPKKMEPAAPAPPAVKRIEPEVAKVAPAKPEVKRLEPEMAVKPKPSVAEPKREGIGPDELLRQARPSERETRAAVERPSPRSEARPAVRVVQKPEKPGGNIIYRAFDKLKHSGPAGKFLAWSIYYTLIVQVWVTIVVLLGLIVLWRRH